MLALTILTLVSVGALTLALGTLGYWLTVLECRADIATRRADALSRRVDRATARIVRLEDERGM